MAKISINGKRWSILLVSQQELQDAYLLGHGKKPGSNLEGICDYASRKILIDQALSADQRKSALRHELIHLFIPTLSERQVLRLEQLITQAGRII